MKDVHIAVEVEILITTKLPFSSTLEQRIKEEINIFCSRLEKLEGYSNHIYLHSHEVEERK
jgi:hypothetical protein